MLPFIWARANIRRLGRSLSNVRACVCGSTPTIRVIWLPREFIVFVLTRHWLAVLAVLAPDMQLFMRSLHNCLLWCHGRSGPGQRVYCVFIAAAGARVSVCDDKLSPRVIDYRMTKSSSTLPASSCGRGCRRISHVLRLACALVRA